MAASERQPGNRGAVQALATAAATALLVLTGAGCASEACPDRALITTEINNATGGDIGTLTFRGKVVAVETCDGDYCWPGRAVAMLTVDAIDADCTSARVDLKVEGDQLPVRLPPGATSLAVGDEVTIGCAMQHACADGCKVGPYETNRGPCWHMEFGCRARCFALFVEGA